MPVTAPARYQAWARSSTPLGQALSTTLYTRTILLITGDAYIAVRGSLDLARETLDYSPRTESQLFSVGLLPIDVGVGGTLKSPRILPRLSERTAANGAAVGIPAVLAPLSGLLPTVQFGRGDMEANTCAVDLQAEGKRPNPASAASEAGARGEIFRLLNQGLH